MHLRHPPRFDPSNNWRFRYHGMFLALAIIVVLADISLAIFMFIYPFGTPSYLYGTAMAVSIIEAVTISVDVALIEFHVGTRTHLDVGKALMPLWCASLSINIAYFIGGASGATGDDASVYKVGLFLVAVSQLSGLCLTIMSILLHILLLTDPDPKAHGYHPKEKGHHHRHGSRRRRDRDDDEEDDEGDLSGDTLLGDEDDEADGGYKGGRRR
ncbi:hypothetical protein JCM6882_004202 [Rhodosporidiobolus microsporus]